MRVGIDGAWVGANKGKSYFSFLVDPGDHQVCTDWQSGFFKGIGAATTFAAEAGKVTISVSSSINDPEMLIFR